MKKSLFGKIILMLVAVMTMSVIFAGCGKKAGEELTVDEYKEKASVFYDKLQDYDKKITSIDSKDKGATEELLKVLDDMNADFQEFGALEPPKQIPEAKEHASNAANLMNTAVTYFHHALSDEETNTDALANARLNYSNAIIEVKNVGIALQNSGVE